MTADKPDPAEVARLIEAGDLTIRPGPVITHHLAFGTVWVRLPDFVDYKGWRCWVTTEPRASL